MKIAPFDENPDLLDTAAALEQVALARLWAAQTRFVDDDVFDDVTARSFALHRFTAHVLQDRRVTRLHDGEPPLSLPRANPEEEVPSLAAPTSLKPDETVPHVIPTSIQISSCRDCDGRGRTRHQDCRGSGRVFCPAREDCGSCAGSGRVVQADGGRYRCGACSGRGERTCTRCRGIGERPCTASSCVQGLVTCEPCAGGGERATYRTVAVKREVAVLERWTSPAAGEVPFPVPWTSADPVVLPVRDRAAGRSTDETAALTYGPEDAMERGPRSADTNTDNDPNEEAEPAEDLDPVDPAEATTTAATARRVLHPVAEVDAALHAALAKVAREEDVLAVHLSVAVDACSVTELDYRHRGEAGRAWIVDAAVFAPDAIRLRGGVLPPVLLAVSVLAMLALLTGLWALLAG